MSFFLRERCPFMAKDSRQKDRESEEGTKTEKDDQIKEERREVAFAHLGVEQRRDERANRRRREREEQAGQVDFAPFIDVRRNFR